MRLSLGDGFRLLVEGLVRQVNTVGPHNSAYLRIDRNFSAASRVVQGRQDSGPPFSREVDVPYRAIHRHGSAPTRVIGVKMRYRMIFLIPVPVDHNP